MNDRNKGRQGYKNTRIGWIPEVWETPSLESVTQGIGDGIHTTPTYVETSEYYFINGNNLMDGQVVILNETKCVCEDEYLKHRKELGHSTLLLSINGTVGNIAYYGDERVILGKSAAYINCCDTLSKQFVFAFLNSSKAHSFFRGEWTGSTIKNLSLASLRQMPIPLPPLPEQKSIASVLECWDRAIHKYEVKIEKKKNIKKGLMQRLLSGRQRLPGFDGAWKKTKIGSIAMILSGGTPAKSNQSFWKGSIPWISSSDLKENEICDFKIHRFISEEAIKLSATKLIPANSILVVSRVGVGKVALSRCDICTSQDFQNLVIIRNSINAKYLTYQLKRTVRKLVRLNQGTSISGFLKKDLKRLQISLPSLPEQKAISSVLSSADSEIKALENKLDLVRGQKKYLLNNLVTGTIRLPEFRSDGGVE